MGKGDLDALPENGQGIGVDTDAQDFCAGSFGALVKKPVDGGGFAVGHGGHHAGERILANALQLLLQRVRQVDGVQFPFSFQHGMPPKDDPFFYLKRLSEKLFDAFLAFVDFT